MVLLTDGKNRIRDLINSDLNNGQWGTGVTAALPSDTGLETAVAATSKAVTSTTADKQITIDHNLPSTDGNGSTLSEFVINLNAGTDFLSRIVITGLAKQSTEQWQTTTILFIE